MHYDDVDVGGGAFGGFCGQDSRDSRAWLLLSGEAPRSTPPISPD